MARINLWSSPRNISTALMYSFAQHNAFEVIDEPLYAHYLIQKPEQQNRHPSSKAIIQTQNNNGNTVLENLLNGPIKRTHLLAKQMTHHLVNLNHERLLPFSNIILIRPPIRIIHSYQKVIQQPNMDDIGIKDQLNLFNYFKDRGVKPAVIDTHELLKNPEKVLSLLFQDLDIEFDKSMLCWKAGPKPEDGIWARHWYKNAHKSIGFKKLEEKEIHLEKEQLQLLERCEPIYKTLFEHAIKA